jgi:hypothetical protein
MIDVALATKGRNSELRLVLRQLKQQTIFDRCQLWIIDGNDGNETLDICQEEMTGFATQCHYFRDKDTNKPSTWPILYNFLINKGNNPLVSYWSDDIILSTNELLENCVAAINGHAAVTIPSRDVNDEDTPSFMHLNEHTLRYPVINYGLIKRDWWQHIGGLDEEFLFYYADVFFATQLATYGQEAVKLPLEEGFIINNRHDKIWRNEHHTRLRDDSITYYRKCRELSCKN